ncbi:MAG: hypothetical protein ABIF06_00180 [bacterium]
MDEISKTDWNILARAKDKKVAFVDYVEGVIKVQKETNEDLMKSGYKVCGALQFNELSEVPEFNRILKLACDLEIPKAHRTDKRPEIKIWKEIIGLLKKAKGVKNEL